MSGNVNELVEKFIVLLEKNEDNKDKDEENSDFHYADNYGSSFFEASDINDEENRDFFYADNFGNFFFQVSGADELVNAFELKKVMKMIFPKEKHFSLETCRSMVSSVDQNRTK